MSAFDPSAFMSQPVKWLELPFSVVYGINVDHKLQFSYLFPLRSRWDPRLWPMRVIILDRNSLYHLQQFLNRIHNGTHWNTELTKPLLSYQSLFIMRTGNIMNNRV